MKVCLRQFIGLLLAGCTPCLVGAARGDWSYDFQSPLPASFVIKRIGPPSGTFTGGIESGVLRLADSQQGGFFGGVGRETSQVFDNARISGTLNPTENSDDFLGLNLRNQAAGDATYGARIEFDTGRLRVFKIVDFLTAFDIDSDSPEQGSQPLLADLARSYFVQFDAVDNVLDARVFDQAGGSELLHVHYTDNQGIGGPPLGPGFAGVSAFPNEGGSLDATFDNLSATAIPEPSTYVLAVIGMAALALCRQFRCKQ